MAPTKHLDLGCGNNPRNPYRCDQLYGVDIMAGAAGETDYLKQVDLATEKIPFADNFFDSVSAYDVLEHIPRSLLSAGRQCMVFPFVELMNEIWRVLRPGGIFYAVTPAYPRPEAFMDPTHVNIITDRTHRYFADFHLGARAYGFTGSFGVERVKWIRPKYELEPRRLTAFQLLRKITDRITGRNSHLLWELRAIK